MSVVMNYASMELVLLDTKYLKTNFRVVRQVRVCLCTEAKNQTTDVCDSHYNYPFK